MNAFCPNKTINSLRGCWPKEIRRWPISLTAYGLSIIHRSQLNLECLFRSYVYRIVYRGYNTVFFLLYARFRFTIYIRFIYWVYALLVYVVRRHCTMYGSGLAIGDYG